MGGEFGQRREWQHDESLEWHVLQYPLHAGVQRWVRDLNRFYRGEPALHELDFDAGGLRVDRLPTTRRHSVVAFLRKGERAEDRVLVVCNFTPVLRDELSRRRAARRLLARVPEQRRAALRRQRPGQLRRRRGGAAAGARPLHSLTLTLPPLGGAVLQAAVTEHERMRSGEPGCVEPSPPTAASAPSSKASRRRSTAGASRSSGSSASASCVEADCLRRRPRRRALRAALSSRREGDDCVREVPMAALGNDRWRGAASASTQLGPLRYTVDGLGRSLPVLAPRLARRVEPTDIRWRSCAAPQLVDGRRARARRRRREARCWRSGRARCAARPRWTPSSAHGVALDEALSALVASAIPIARCATRYDRELPLVVDRERARFSTWYELFPRSTAPRAGRARHVSRLRGAAADTSPRWASTCSICRRSIPIGRDQPQGAQQRARRRPGDPAARGRSARAEGGHKAMHPAARHAGRFPPAGRQGARARHRDRARHRLPVRARPSLRQRASRVVPPAARRHASSTPRTRPRNTRTSIRSISSRERLARRCGAS